LADPLEAIENGLRQLQSRWDVLAERAKVVWRGQNGAEQKVRGTMEDVEGCCGERKIKVRPGLPSFPLCFETED
jgi:hypothetical protein